MDPIQAVQRLAQAQHDVLAADDGRPLGISPRRLRRWARRNGWTLPHPRVLVAPWANPRAFGTRTWIARSAVGGGAVLYGRSSLHALRVRSTPPATLELVIGHQRSLPALGDGVVVHRSRSLQDIDLVVHEGLPTTTAARTLADLAAVRSLPALRADVLACLQRGALQREELAAYLQRHRRFAGRPKLRAVVDQLRIQHADSGFEWACRQLLADGGLRPYPAPFPWLSADGRVLHLDIAFPARWVHLDVIGEAYHGSEVAWKDRLRWNALDRGGWRTVWVDARAMRNPGGLLAEIRERLADADPDRPPALRADCGCRVCGWAPAR